MCFHFIFLCQIRCRLCKRFCNRTSAFFGTDSRTTAVINIYNGICGGKLLSVNACGILAASNFPASHLIRCDSNSKVRLGELDKLMAKLYEDNVLGRVTDDFFQMMMKNYEREQKELTMAVADGEQVLQSSEQKSTDTRLLIRTFREMTDITELTPIIVNKLIERIEVHNNDKSSGHCYVKVDIYFTGVGMISIPSEEELLAMMEDIRKNPEEYRLAA